MRDRVVYNVKLYHPQKPGQIFFKCGPSATPGGRKSVLYFDVSASGRHIAFTSKFWTATKDLKFNCICAT